MSKLSEKFAAGKKALHERQAAEQKETAVVAPSSYVRAAGPAHGAVSNMKIETLKEQIETLRAAKPVMKISPNEIRPSAWANRHQDSYKSDEFAEFKKEIQSANGNIQPIKVRPTANPIDGFKYEIVFGHRRHQACLELGIDVTVIVEEIDEKTLFVEMDRENRQRADLRPYEQGLMYARAIDQGLFASLRKLAEDIGADATNVSKAVNIARLPTAVLDAFESRLDIQYRWYADLSKALVQDPDLLLSRATEIASKRAAGEAIPSVAALSMLFGKTAKPAPKKPKVVKVGSNVLSISESKDKVSFEVDKLGKEKHIRIEKFIVDLMAE